MRKVFFGLAIIIILFLSVPVSNQNSTDYDLTSTESLIQTGKIALQEITSTSFVSKWDTTKSGTSNGTQVMLPLYDGGTYNFEVDWGDGNVETITSYDQGIHTYYDDPGNYQIVINGTLVGWRVNFGGDRLKIIEISQWGNINFGNLGGYFDGAQNLVLKATDAPDLTGTTDLSYAFKNCDYLGDTGSMDSWDVSSITDMKGMFDYVYTFNQPLGNWNVSSVTDMSIMFNNAYGFNQPLNNWDVSSVTDMNSMFNGAYGFNQPLNNWDVSSVTNTNNMFRSANSFNQPLNNWDVSSVTDMAFMFRAASLFDQSIGNWDVSSVTSMFGMFSSAISFNQPLNNWDVSNVDFMISMFSYAYSFNQLIGNWDVSYVQYMDCMFEQATSFNQPIGNWDVSSVSIMNSMFNGATSFNQPIGDWDVSHVTSMDEMFYGATSFNQPIGDWDVSHVTKMNGMFQGITLSYQNYDNLLIGWSDLALPYGIFFHGGNSEYTSNAIAARQVLVDSYSWTITDGGYTSLTYPDVSSPNDISYEQSTTGNLIEWTVGDINPGSYNVTMDGILYAEGTWTNGSILVDIDGLDFGTYEFSIYVYDTDGIMEYDVVMVTVIDSTHPDISSPDNINYEQATTGNLIEWIVGDINPGIYNITSDGILYTENTWTNGTISVDVDGLAVGVYVFIIFVFDTHTNMFSDAVAVSVNEAPVTDTVTETETDTVTETLDGTNTTITDTVTETDTIDNTITETLTDTDLISSIITEYITTIPTDVTDTADAPILFTFVIMGLVVFVLRRRH